MDTCRLLLDPYNWALLSKETAKKDGNREVSRSLVEKDEKSIHFRTLPEKKFLNKFPSEREEIFVFLICFAFYYH